MKIYLFSQALDNKSEDDWFEVEGQKPIRMHDENKTAFVHNKIFELCSTMEILAENDLKIFYYQTNDEYSMLEKYFEYRKYSYKILNDNFDLFSSITFKFRIFLPIVF